MNELWTSVRESLCIIFLDILTACYRSWRERRVLTAPGLVGMQINLLNSGTFFFISDHCHVIENASKSISSLNNFNRKQWRDGIPQGWLARYVSLPLRWLNLIDIQSDHPAWFQSTQRLKRLESTTKGRVIPGHDKETFLQLQSEIKEYLS